MDQIIRDLMKLAAEMVMRQNMPSRYYDDWNWPKGMQITSWRKVSDAADKADEQARDWAVRLRKIIDTLPKDASQPVNSADAEGRCPKCNKPVYLEQSYCWKCGCKLRR